MSAVPQFPAANDPDALETQEWLDALEAVLEREGPERAHFLLERLIDKARRSGAYIPFSQNTAYVNTIPPHMEERSPGNVALEERIRSICRWNAMVMVARANKSDDELGGHIASFASVGTLFGTGQQHFWHAPHEGHGGDLIYFQGHASPGVYARSLMEGRLSEDRLLNFRREVDGKGVSSYPHPWLMPEYWQFPTVSMGLGPIQSIYMARYLKYLEARGLAQTSNRKVWVFCGDGEMDEPESLGAIGLASREKLDNLIFVVNCNLQRLDGPVRGNGKIIQELEGDFRGAGWNTIKEMRDQFAIPIPDDKLDQLPFYVPPADAPEMKYLHERRKALGGYLPQRRQKADKVPAVPSLAAFDALLKGSGEGREISTTMAFVRALTALIRDKDIGKRIVPIVPDEARTFGMEGMFRQLGIFAAEGQKYEPVDKDQVMYYREDKQGQIL